ncbi:hypothetical protein HMPREF1510_1736 [Streptococcus sp. ACC21]|nr:hypothetical protein HMPREF1510_1736 [Streptococcus sp. ACC21]
MIISFQKTAPFFFLLTRQKLKEAKKKTSTSQRHENKFSTFAVFQDLAHLMCSSP